MPIETATTTVTRMAPAKPSAYWDRCDGVVRDWTTNQPMPTYEGLCLVYLDTRGPVLLNTYLRDGQRHWEGME